MRKTWITAFLILILLSLSAPSYGVKVVPGANCKQSGQTQIYKGKLFKCIKLGKKLYWNNGKPIASSSPSSTSSPKSSTVSPKPSSSQSTSVIPSASPSSSPANRPLVLPELSETFFGKTNPLIQQFDSCWFAKKATNSSNQVSVAVRQVSQVIGADGTVKGEVWWMIPSLAPGESTWYSLYFSDITNRGGCEKMPSRVFDKPLTVFSQSTPITNTINLTSEADRPKVIDVIQSPGTTIGKLIFKLRILNQSPDKELRDDLLSFINFIFLDVNGKPIYALSGRISGTVPPKGEATLSSPMYIQETSLPIGTVKVVGSLNFVLCKTNQYPEKDLCSY